MAENKIFAGPRVRRIRNGLGLTQTAMAEALAISPSYLNLIERNQRPLTVQLLLKLAAAYKVDLDELRGSGGDVAGGLREVFADPLLAGEVPGDQELVEVSEAAPNAAAGVVKLYRAYREQAARLTDLAELLAREGHDTSLSSARLPMDEVREKLERRPHHFPSIEEAAEAFHARLDVTDGILPAVREWMKVEHGIVVRTLPVHAMPAQRRRFDRHSMRLFISERLSVHDQMREIVQEACLLALRNEILAEIENLQLSGNEARRLARFELARYAAHALMMPYGQYLAQAVRLRYDIDLLRVRFGVSFEQAAMRLTMLARPGAAGIPFFMMEVDHAGNRLRRAGAQGFPHSRFGGACAKLNIHSAFSQPSQILVDHAEMPDGLGYMLLARTLDGPHVAFQERVRRTAMLLGCDIGFAEETVYGQAIRAGAPVLPIGAACRLCERQGCLSRAEPPVTRPLGLDEMVTGLSAFDFQ
jgi:predicted transcriptional regulator/DNA-binding XRE family transcriptional regulator